MDATDSSSVVLSQWPPLLLFKLQWLLLVAGHGDFTWLALLLLPLQALLLWRRQGTATLLKTLPFAAAGMMLDQLLLTAGVLQFDTAHIPPDLVLLWLAFAVTLPVLPLERLALPLQASLGVILGVAGYGAGYLLGAVGFGVHPAQALAVLAVCWSVLLPARQQLLQWRATTSPALMLGALLMSPMPAEAASDWVVIGQARFHWLWFTLYDATLEAPTREFRFPATAPFRLSLQYHRPVKAEQIVTATLDQWRRQQLAWTPEWEALLQQTIPAVAQNDVLQLEVATDGTAALLHNNQEAARFTDTGFVTAFAGIWLGERTTDPGFRRQLMGETL